MSCFHSQLWQKQMLWADQKAVGYLPFWQRIFKGVCSKVCPRQNALFCLVLFPPLQFIYVFLHTVGETLAAASLSERGRGCGQEGVAAVVATDGPAPLRLPQWQRAEKWNSTACKLSPDVNSHRPKWKKHSWFTTCDVSLSCGVAQLITAFEKALSLIDTVPGEEHRKVSVDYIRCLSKVSLNTPHAF